MANWKIDPAHTEIAFKVKHLMISNVRGYFKEFDGTIMMPDDNFINASISFTANTSSVDTNNSMRDEHLRSADFFDSEKFPTLSFVSKSITSLAENNFSVVGDLTMHGVTKEVTLNTVLNGRVVDAYGNNVISFDVSGSLNRTDFGLVWNAAIETGGVVVSEEVKLEISAEFKEEK
jgi:polyisoprenoid-binding protein YceI